MIKHIFILLVIALFLIGTGKAQQTIYNTDSLLAALSKAQQDTNKVKLLQTLGDYYRKKNDFTNAKKYLLQAGELSKQLNYQNGVHQYLFYYADVMMRQSKYDSVLYYSKKLQAMAAKENSALWLANSYYYMGIGYDGIEQYDTAIQCYLKAVKYDEQQKEYLRMGHCYNQLMTIFMQTEQYEKATEYGEKALELFRQYGPNNVTVAMENLAATYNLMKKYNKAIPLFEEAVAISRKNKNERDELIGSANLAETYLDDNIKDRKVKELIDRSFFLARKLENWQLLSHTYYNAGLYAFMYKQYEKARVYTDSSLSVTPEIDKDIRQQRYALLAAIAFASQDLEKGKYYDDKVDSIRQKINTDNINRNVVEMQTKYETEKKETQIQLQQAQLKQKNILNYIFAGSVLVLALILLLSYRNYQNRKKLQQAKINELEKEKQLLAVQSLLKGQEEERNRLAKDLHDGLGGLLSGVKLQLGVMKGNLILTEENGALFNRALQRLDESILEMRRVAHNMMPESLIKLGLEQALQDFCDNINVSQSLRINTVFMGLDKRLDESTEVIVYRIVQELVNNVIKHSGATEMLVQVIRNDQMLTLTVEDNGKGFDIQSAQALAGAGLQNIRSRVNYLRGKLDIQSQPGKGTSVYVECEVE